ncbi:MAG: hypothetical protein JNG88_01070 [Phycisphaerales bacterium]|nr:hypothetical protein [Phycisphaerales bacterium]
MTKRDLTGSAVCLMGLTLSACTPLAPTELSALLGDAATNPDVFENVTYIGADGGQVYLSRNDLPDNLLGDLLAEIVVADSTDSSPPEFFRFDVGAVGVSDGQFNLIADDLVSSPIVSANSRWLIWQDSATGSLIRLDRTTGNQADALTSNPDNAYAQILLLDEDTLWVKQFDYSDELAGAAPQSALKSINLASLEVTDFGDAIDDSAFQIAIRSGVIYTFETIVDNSSATNPDMAVAGEPVVDFSPPDFRYRLIAFDINSRTRNVLLESFDLGIMPADPQFDSAGRLLWREDRYDAATTTFRAMTLADQQVVTMHEFVGEIPMLPEFDGGGTEDFSFQPTGRSSAVLAWNERGLLIGEVEYRGGTSFFPNTTQRYIYRGFDGTEFDVFSFETSGLFGSPITAIADDTIICRDVINGELILTNIKTRESKRVAIFP